MNENTRLYEVWDLAFKGPKPKLIDHVRFPANKTPTQVKYALLESSRVYPEGAELWVTIC